MTTKDENQPKTYLQALAAIGSLSKPSKMPGWGWSISAEDCITGTKLRQVEGSTCSTCYALKGRYGFQNVKDAHARRRAALEGADFVDAFVAVLTRVYARTENPVFRWFDAGDLPHVEALEKIIEIARRTPHVQHWLPTRELGIVRQVKTGFPDNLTVRLSAPMIGQSITPLPGTTWSGVNVEGIATCPAPTQGNKCLDCRLCWSKEPVSYHLH